MHACARVGKRDLHLHEAAADQQVEEREPLRGGGEGRGESGARPGSLRRPAVPLLPLASPSLRTRGILPGPSTRLIVPSISLNALS